MTQYYAVEIFIFISLRGAVQYYTEASEKTKNKPALAKKKPEKNGEKGQTRPVGPKK